MTTQETVDATFSISVTQYEKRRLVDKANAERRTLSGLCRHLILLQLDAQDIEEQAARTS